MAGKPAEFTTVEADRTVLKISLVLVRHFPRVIRMQVGRKLTLPALLTAVSLGLLLGVVVIERTGRPVSLVYGDPAYIRWLSDLEGEGSNHEFSSVVTPSEITEMPLGYYRPEVTCHRAPCAAYGDIGNRPKEPTTYAE
jgi:hypothetical protein